MSRATNNQEPQSGKKAYHSPQLQKFGKVSDLTLANTGTGSTNDSGSFMIYAS